MLLLVTNIVKVLSKLITDTDVETMSEEVLAKTGGNININNIIDIIILYININYNNIKGGPY